MQSRPQALAVDADPAQARALAAALGAAGLEAARWQALEALPASCARAPARWCSSTPSPRTRSCSGSCARSLRTWRWARRRWCCCARTRRPSATPPTCARGWWGSSPRPSRVPAGARPALPAGRAARRAPGQLSSGRATEEREALLAHVRHFARTGRGGTGGRGDPALPGRSSPTASSKRVRGTPAARARPRSQALVAGAARQGCASRSSRAAQARAPTWCWSSRALGPRGAGVGTGPVERAPANPLRLLFVDDDAELCRLFSSLLRRHGFEVTLARDGVEGFRRALDGGLDAVVADLNMPRLDGWGLLRLLREDARTRELPVAFLSCHDDYRETLRALQAGAQAYFSKTVKLDALAAQLRTLLEPQRATRDALHAAARPCGLALGSVGTQWLLRELHAQRATGHLQCGGWLGPPRAAARGRRARWAPRPRSAPIARRASAPLRPSSRRGPSGLQWRPGSVEEAKRDLSLPAAGAARGRPGDPQRARPARARGADDGRHAQRGERGALLALHAGGSAALAGDGAPAMRGALTPREVLARVDTSPLEIEEIVRDLVRRGVLTLSKSGARCAAPLAASDGPALSRVRLDAHLRGAALAYSGHLAQVKLCHPAAPPRRGSCRSGCS